MGWKARRDAHNSEIMRQYEHQQEQLAQGNYWGALGHTTIQPPDVGVHRISYQTETGERVLFTDD